MPLEPIVRFIAFDPRARHAAAAAAPAVEILKGADIEPEAVRWLWPGWLALGKVHLLAGSPGSGKTTIALSLAATITAGGRWPDGGAVESGDVLIWSAEDGIADTLLPRFLAAGGVRERLHFAGGVWEQSGSRPFDPAADMPKLVEAARGLPRLKLVILDPVSSAVSGDSHKNSETRRGLQPVVDLACSLDCLVIGITHFGKNTSGREPLERVLGSTAFGAVARVVLATVKPADPDAPRRMVRAKSNLGPDTGGFEYQLFGAPVPGREFLAQRVDWGQALEGSARELMAIEQPDGNADSAKDAETFLRDMLNNGPVSAKEIAEAGRAHGHWSSSTLHRAKAALGIKTVKEGMKGGWVWQLPSASEDSTTARRHQHDQS
jgi:putative DNA primase/helicase